MKNLLTRTISGIVFIGIMVGCLLGGDVPYACLMLFLVVGMLSEFYTLTLGQGKWLLKIIGILSGVFLWTVSFYFYEFYMDDFGIILLLLMTTMVLLSVSLVLLSSRMYQYEEHPALTAAHLLLGVAYIAVPFSFINLLGKFGGYPALLWLFIILWSNDVGAYVFGMLFGKHKLCPFISPKKSWEGFAGGVLTALAAGYTLSSLGMMTYGLFHGLVIALLIAVFGVLGDLIESLFKRSAGVKDSGKIIPGHGGLLDRFDAALLALPVACLYLIVVYFFDII